MTERLEDLQNKLIKVQTDKSQPDEVILLRNGFVLGRQLGSGAYAKVYFAEYHAPSSTSILSSLMPRSSKADASNESTSKQVLACKVVDSNRATKDFIKKFFPREISIMSKLNHHFLIRIHSILRLGPKYYLFMTFCPNGDMLTFLKRHGAIREAVAGRWFAQIVSGMEYLHSRDITHRDLKCENILLSGEWNIKIADFGFSRVFKDADEKSKTFCGSIMYVPPEIIAGHEYLPKLADVWSMGICLFIMLNKAMPFDDSNIKALYAAQMGRGWKLRSKLVHILSKEVKTLLYVLLDPIPEKRKTVAEIRRDPWLSRGSFNESTLELKENSNFLQRVTSNLYNN